MNGYEWCVLAAMSFLYILNLVLVIFGAKAMLDLRRSEGSPRLAILLAFVALGSASILVNSVALLRIATGSLHAA